MILKVNVSFPSETISVNWRKASPNNHFDVKNLVSKPYEHQQVEHEYEDQGAKKAEDKGIEGESSLLGEDVALGEDVQGLPLNAAALPSVRPKQYDMNITALRKKFNPFLFYNHNAYMWRTLDYRVTLLVLSFKLKTFTVMPNPPPNGGCIEEHRNHKHSRENPH